jgi:hypothetical protein
LQKGFLYHFVDGLYRDGDHLLRLLTLEGRTRSLISTDTPDQARSHLSGAFGHR